MKYSKNLIITILVAIGLCTAVFLRVEAPLPEMPRPKFVAPVMIPDKETGTAPGIVMDAEFFQALLEYSNKLRWRAMGRE